MLIPEVMTEVLEMIVEHYQKMIGKVDDLMIEIGQDQTSITGDLVFLGILQMKAGEIDVTTEVQPLHEMIGEEVTEVYLEMYIRHAQEVEAGGAGMKEDPEIYRCVKTQEMDRGKNHEELGQNLRGTGGELDLYQTRMTGGAALTGEDLIVMSVDFHPEMTDVDLHVRTEEASLLITEKRTGEGVSN